MELQTLCYAHISLVFLPQLVVSLIHLARKLQNISLFQCRADRVIQFESIVY